LTWTISSESGLVKGYGHLRLGKGIFGLVKDKSDSTVVVALGSGDECGKLNRHEIRGEM